MINILFFAKYREQMGLSCLELHEEGILTVADLLAWLKLHYPAQTRFTDDKSLLIAVNQDIATTRTAIKSGDEVAFFPPVTGG